METMDLWFFWDIFRKKWKVIILVAFIFGMATGVFSKLFLKPRYESSISLYFGRITGQGMSLSEMMADSDNAALSTMSQGLNLGTSLSEDYNKLINFEVITSGVNDELAKMGRWEGKEYKVDADNQGRIMRIIVSSEDPRYSQVVAGLFAKEFLNKMKKLVGVQNAQVIEEPQLNLKPAWPNIPKFIALGWLGGFFLSFVFYVALSFLDRTIRSSREVEESLQLPVVGTVHKDQDYKLDKNNPLLFSGSDKSAVNRSQIAEDFRVLRVNLINRNQGKKEGSVIAVTSSHAKEGKTFCTANVGAALAEAGYRVLLVDCDTGKRGLQSYFGTSSDKGLMNILADDAEFEDVVKHNLNDLNMDVLFCGNQNVNTANLMISPKFKALMEKLKKQYDYAFLDISTNLGKADIVSAGSSADSVLLLVRSGKSEEASVKQTIDALKRAKLDISGVILNGVDEEK